MSLYGVRVFTPVNVMASTKKINIRVKLEGRGKKGEM